MGEDFNGTALRVCRSEQMHKEGSGQNGYEVCKPDYDLRGVCELWKRTKESS